MGIIVKRVGRRGGSSPWGWLLVDQERFQSKSTAIAAVSAVVTTKWRYAGSERNGLW